MPRGRPVGTKKRSAAEAAARSIVDGWHIDIHSAAIAYFHRHVGGLPRRKIVGNDLATYRNFVGYVEEAYRELIADPRNLRGSLRRTYGPLAARSKRRARQVGRNTSFQKKLKAEVLRMSFKARIRAMLDI